MFEQSRACDGAVFGDVPDQQHGKVAVFGDPDERGRHFSHLGGPAGKPLGQRRCNGLYRVDDHQLGLHVVDLPEDGREVGFCREVEGGLECAGTLSPQTHLADRFFGRDVEHPLAGGRGAGGDLKQEG